MRHFGFLGKLVLALLLLGAATGFQDLLSSGPGHESAADISLEDYRTNLQTDSRSIAQEVLHVMLSFFCPAPACAGDLEGDVQGD